MGMQFSGPNQGCDLGCNRITRRFSECTAKMGGRLRSESITPDAPVRADVPPPAWLARLDAGLVERIRGLEARRPDHLRMMQLRQAQFVQRCRPMAMLV